MESSRNAKRAPNSKFTAKFGRHWLPVLIFMAVWTLWSRRTSRSGADEFSSPYRCDGKSVHSSAKKFDWDKILPSESLNWTPCYGKFQCARFVVPLDYSKPHAEKAVIALAKYPSKYPVGHENWKGPILYNPGGPGGSGVDSILLLGEALSKLIGDDYDHIGFDPRGIGRTTPRISLFQASIEKQLFDIHNLEAINATSQSLARIYARGQLMSGLAEKRAKKVVENVGTATVAEDMLRITRAHGREKLLYWGFSYGTVLGITYASMFPNNIERMIVDGVVDTEDYYTSKMSKSLLDTDAELQLLAKACSLSPRCPLHAPNPSTILQRIHDILNSLRRKPIPILDSNVYGLVDYSLARFLLFRSLYSPTIMFPAITAAFADFERGSAEAFLKVLPLFEGEQDRANTTYACDCSKQREISIYGWEYLVAIACGDGDDVSDVGLDELQRYYSEQAEETSEFVEMWPMYAFCAGWKPKANRRFAGPFGGNTSFPLLLIGNTADPVTPLWAAKKMSQFFPNSVVLTQNGPGHCSVAVPSLCTGSYIRAYFRNGTLPKQGTTCEVDGFVFEPGDVGRVREGVAAMKNEEVLVESDLDEEVVGELSELWAKGVMAKMGAF